MADAPFPELYVPEEMMKEEACRSLKKYGSIREVFRHAGEEPDRETFADFWIAFCELRTLYDFEYFAVAYLVVRDKLSARDVPFRLNRGQKRLLDALERKRLAGEPIRVMVLKARQWGCSTLVQQYMLWIQLRHKRNWNSVVCAHIRDASITIRAMFQRAVKTLPVIGGVPFSLAGYQGTQSIKELAPRGCLITVGTAVEPDSVRSQDVKMAHFSEMAYYPNTPNNSTEDLESSITGSIPPEPYTLIVRESTANGVGDYFCNEWEKAKKGESAYEAVFVPWFCNDTYRKDFDGGYYGHDGRRRAGSVEDFVRSLDDYEAGLFRMHGECTLEHLNWRRIKRAEMSGDAKMKQEFPSDDIEAFQDSGTPAFRSEDIEAMRGGCCLPEAVGMLAAATDPAHVKIKPSIRKGVLRELRFIPDAQALADLQSSDVKTRERAQKNRLRIWNFPVVSPAVSNRYLVVLDPQKGLSESADWGVITVFDRYWMMHGDKPWVAAEWRGRVDKDIAVWIAAQIAAWYNNALLVVESNTYDSVSKEDDAEFIFDAIADCYPNLYSRTPADRIRAGMAVEYGFHTNRNTKPMILNNYVAILRERGYVERSDEALNEARTYEQKQNGSFGAKENRHDDILMTRMIGLHICYNEMSAPRLTGERSERKTVKPVSEAMI